MVALTVLLTMCSGAVAWLGEEQESKPSVFETPRLVVKYSELNREIQAAFKAARYDEAERLSLEATRTLPQVALGYYNLACAQSRQKKSDQALASLALAVQHGFNQAEWLGRDPDFESVRTDKRFVELLEKARKPPAQPAETQRTITPAVPAGGKVLVSEANTAWNPAPQVFQVLFASPSAPRSAPAPAPASAPANSGSETRPAAATDPVVRGQGQLGEELQRWFDEGTAAGNRGDFYDNHDGAHSLLPAANFPQLTYIEFDEAARKERLNLGLQVRFLYNQVTLGNASMADVSGPYWRSLPRMAYANPPLMSILYLQYLSNHLYLYPEHRDHDPGRNGKDGHGDVYPTNTPFVVISQGSSGSDQPFLSALACTMAAFRPDVKKQLIEQRILSPTLQMILRSSLHTVAKPEDYLTGKAHPSVFRGEDLDPQKMIQMAHGMTELPPRVVIRVREEDEAALGRDYFEIGPREHLLDCAAVIARVCCSTKYSRRMVVSAEESRDPNGHPLTWHWQVLRGDSQKIEIRPLNSEKSVVELIVPYHERRPTFADSNIESNRVDIGAFVHNGRHYSAPAFITFQFLDDETRVYSEDHRILSVDYRSQADGGNYVDPMLHAARTWRDEYRYDSRNRLAGWTRRRGDKSEDFTADGALVIERDKSGRPVKARTVVYAESNAKGAASLEQREGDEILTYAYDSPEDQIGRVANHEAASAATATSTTPSNKP
jgi:hypothetical protein